MDENCPVLKSDHTKMAGSAQENNRQDEDEEFEPNVILENILKKIEDTPPPTAYLMQIVKDPHNNLCQPTRMVDSTISQRKQQQQQEHQTPIASDDDQMLEIEIDSSSSPLPTSSSTSSLSTSSSLTTSAFSRQADDNAALTERLRPSSNDRKSVRFDTVVVYHFTRSQGFSSIPSQGGSTLGMKMRHFRKREISVDMFEEVRRRSRREILLKIKLEEAQTRKRRRGSKRVTTPAADVGSPVTNNCDEIPNNNDNSTAIAVDAKNAPDTILDLRVSSAASTSTNATTPSSSSSSSPTDSSSDEDYNIENEESYSDYSDISDSELDSDSCIFLQPIGVKLRRSLLRASGVGRIDPGEKRDCNLIRDSRERSGCKCVNQCLPSSCECSRLGINCHVDRVSYPCGCDSAGCGNPQGRTEFDTKRVKGHLHETLYKIGIG